MSLLKKLTPEWALRLGLGIMYLYSGFDIFSHPSAWYWAMPYWLKQFITSFVSLGAYLKLQGVLEIIFAAIFLAWFLKPAFVKWVALLSTLEFAAILLLAFVPWNETNFLITFRDIGLLGASLALFVLFTVSGLLLPLLLPLPSPNSADSGLELPVVLTN